MLAGVYLNNELSTGRVLKVFGTRSPNQFKNTCVGLLCALLCSFVPSTTDAFVRTKTCSFVGDGVPCRQDQEPIDVYWKESCVTYYINESGSQDFPVAEGESFHPELLSAIVDSFDVWTQTNCSKIQFAFGGYTCSDVSGKQQIYDENSQNIIIFRDEGWEHASDAIAVTTLLTNPETGEIRDADIELNGIEFRFSNLSRENESEQADVRNTLTHEVGHLLGLDHELDVQESTMFPTALGGEVYKRDLHQDDVQGICSIYPGFESTGGLPVCNPKQIEDRSCTIQLEGNVDCSVISSMRRIPLSTPISLSILFFGVILMTRRRKAFRNALQQDAP